MRNTKKITQREFSGDDFANAEKIARRLGYTQTAYTSSSDLIGLFCLRDRAAQRAGCVILTEEFGFMFVQDMEDLNMEEESPKPVRIVCSNTLVSVGRPTGGMTK